MGVRLGWLACCFFFRVPVFLALVGGVVTRTLEARVLSGSAAVA